MTQKVHPVRLDFQLPLNEETSVDRFVHVYIVVGEQVCVVDTGPAGTEQGIVDALNGLGKSISDLAWVINTHGHPDHIGGNRFLQEAAQPKFVCHSQAARWIEDLDVQYQERPLYGFYELAGKPIQVTRTLEDGDEFDLGGGTTLQVVFTPGHSPGSMSLLCPHDGTLITADAIQPVGGLPLYTDVDQTRASMQRLAALPGVKTLYRSHSVETYMGTALREVINAGVDYLEQVDDAVTQAVAELGSEADPEAITREALVRLGMSPPPVVPLTVTSIMAHV